MMSSEPAPRQLFAEDALLPGGWASNVLLEWNERGEITSAAPDSAAPASAQRARGPVLPGMPNLHSHAFQRAFAGLTEFRGAARDDFWSWRSVMYRFASHVTPEQLERIATWLYVEMLEAGYTSVCEFHYLHQDQDGKPYGDASALAQSVMRAAARAGIGLTLLPVLYQTSDFGGRASQPEQRRFLHSVNSMLKLLEQLQPRCSAERMRLGLAPHSLRAVTPESLRDVLAGLDAIDASAPIHIHIAEQPREVEACLAWSGRRPVDWLLDHADVTQRWCLVHATHMSEEERVRAARSGAVAGLCPTTEANLGDGLFDVPAWTAANGTWGIGSDSHVCVNAAEELLLLEYGQRLQRRERNVLASEARAHTAMAMMLSAVQGGAQASGRALGGLAAGQQADFVVLDAAHPALAGLGAAEMLASHVFASSRKSAIDAVWVGGVARVRGGEHQLRDAAALDFLVTRAELVR